LNRFTALGRLFFGLVATSTAAACSGIADFEPLGFDVDALPPRTDASRDARAADELLEIGLDAGDGAAVRDDCDHDFCDDFEGTRTVQHRWTGVGLAGTGTLLLEAGTLEGRVGESFSKDGHYAGLIFEKPWSLTASGERRRARVAFRARVDTCPGAGKPLVALATFSINGSTIGLEIGEKAGACEAKIVEGTDNGAGGYAYSASTALLVPLGTWEDFALELSEALSSVGGQATIHVGASTTSHPVTPRPDPLKFYHTLGPTQGTLNGVVASVAFDDVRLDYLK
jgi:hypothetical protein